MILNVVSNILFICSSFYIAYLGFRGYCRARFNHEVNFLWAISIAFVGVGFILYLLNPVVQLKGLNWIVHSIDTVVFLLQLCVVYIMAKCDERHSCKFCKRKKVRIVMWIAGPLLLIALAILYFNCNSSLATATTMEQMQLLGIKWLDVTIEILHTIAAFTVFLLIPLDEKFASLRIGFVFLGLSEFAQVVNILIYDYTAVFLYMYEWITAMLMAVYTLVGVHTVVTEE